MAGMKEGVMTGCSKQRGEGTKGLAGMSRDRRGMVMKKNFVFVGLLVVSAFVTLTVFSASAFADSNMRVRIVNETRHNIVNLYASRVGTNSWEEDVLGSDILSVGAAMNLSFAGSEYCLYDFLAVFDDGTRLAKRRLDVCSVAIHRYTQD